MAVDLIESYKKIQDKLQTSASYASSTYSRGSTNYIASSMFNRNSFINSIITRIAIDVSNIDLKHIKVDSATRLQTKVDSPLIDTLSYSANVDQTGRAFIFDAVWSLLDEGAIALVPIQTSVNAYDNTSYDIYSMRVGKIKQWYPQYVRVELYNELNGKREDVIVEKAKAAIIESPFNAILKDTNQTLKMLSDKIALMSKADNELVSGKLNGFIEFDGRTSTKILKERITNRLSDITNDILTNEAGLAGLTTGEKFVSAGGHEVSGVLDEVLRLQQDFYNQLGITENVIKGNASETELNLYYSRTVDTVSQALVDAINKTFISKTARTQGQQIIFYRDPFKTIPVKDLASSIDLLVRNAIISSNEGRALIGKEPVLDENADKLYNPNIADANQMGGIASVGQEDPYATDDQYYSETDAGGGENYF